MRAIPPTARFSERCITDAHHGPLTVGPDRSLCISAGGSQDGPVSVRPGGALALVDVDAEVHGPLSTDAASALTIRGSVLGGPVSVHGTSGYVLIGAAAPSSGGDCPGNTIHGPLKLYANTGGIDVTATRSRDR